MAPTAKATAIYPIVINIAKYQAKNITDTTNTAITDATSRKPIKASHQKNIVGGLKQSMKAPIQCNRNLILPPFNPIKNRLF